MDRSDSRRGRPTLHVVAAERHRDERGLGDDALFGDSIATLVSDLALSEASLMVAPTPAAARYCSTGQPSPPQPTTSTRAAFSFCWPASPISGSSRWRL